jgi:hypothetical protein
MITIFLLSISSCLGFQKTKNNVASNNSPKKSTILSFTSGIGNTSACSLISGNLNNFEKIYVQVKSGVLKPNGKASNLSDWEIVNLGTPKIFVKTPLTGQDQLNNDGSITLDLPMEGSMFLEINAVLSCHECCGKESPNIFKCSSDIMGKPLFASNLQPISLKNVTGNTLSVPLTFKLCLCECR